jgi:hypothetical protein
MPDFCRVCSYWCQVYATAAIECGLRENPALKPRNSGRPRGAPQIPPLRYAAVGMTILFGNARYRFQDELSSRPERTRISCHAALDSLARHG